MAGALIVERKRPTYRQFFAKLATSFLHLDGQGGAKSQSMAVILIGVSIGILSLGLGWLNNCLSCNSSGNLTLDLQLKVFFL